MLTWVFSSNHVWAHLQLGRVANLSSVPSFLLQLLTRNFPISVITSQRLSPNYQTNHLV